MIGEFVCYILSHHIPAREVEFVYNLRSHKNTTFSTEYAQVSRAQCCLHNYYQGKFVERKPVIFAYLKLNTVLLR